MEEVAEANPVELMALQEMEAMPEKMEMEDEEALLMSEEEEVDATGTMTKEVKTLTRSEPATPEEELAKEAPEVAQEVDQEAEIEEEATSLAAEVDVEEAEEATESLRMLLINQTQRIAISAANLSH